MQCDILNAFGNLTLQSSNSKLNISNILTHLSMKSIEDLPHFVTFQGKPEYETTAKKFKSFRPNHSLTPEHKTTKIK